MPFDPNLPTPNTLADANAMRAQLNGLNDKIDAIPGITSAVVDSVTTVGPGQPAIVTVSVIGTVLHISLALPEGQPGLPGAGLAGSAVCQCGHRQRHHARPRRECERGGVLRRDPRAPELRHPARNAGRAGHPRPAWGGAHC